ncbi:intermembrane lipid transfer protein VPS13A-like [Dreissena polymorpha]|uniref:intermembrane lipid transfer protein VPS13A-like n=1 Tax=Dreissena polymorpha TaxID=45954 RepID=UPI0022650089|nr:intermembrane lipid transfer protein VPS13A-like [Dreissena polymorpha]
MVFESLVVDLINKYLGDFVENLDKSQLKLGIWGGDVVLNELDLKESALDDLDLPVKIKAGHIGKLTLKIPWKNLYTEPVIATIDGLYALAVPNVGIKYNAEKEKKEAQENKQKKLQALEEVKKLEAEKDKPKEKKKDSFAEKFATQVIKNLQVEVRNIHVRYEDKYTNPLQPFSIGVTLKELLFRTTDSNWQPCIIKEAVSQIHKLVKLEQLAVYWNSHSNLYEGKEKAEILKSLKSAIQEGNKTNFQHLIRPISSVAHLKITTKPEEHDFKQPKIFLSVIFDDISIGLAKTQYNDVLEMLEGFERLSLMGVYKKYKPSVPLRGHIRTWWHFAYTSILEEMVRRRRRMWSWQHIKLHRDSKLRYKEAYVRKLEAKKVPADLQKTLDECEEFLDVFNLTVLRQQAEVEAEKRGAQRAEDKKNAGWFGGWFGGGKKKDEGKAKGEVENIQQQFYEQFNLEEKNKLYEAIGYQENEVDLTLPKTFVALRIVTKLNNLSVTLRDDSKSELQLLQDESNMDSQLLKLQLKNVYSTVEQRPAASAIKVNAKMDKMTVLGTQQGEIIPHMVSSVLEKLTEQEEALSLIDFLFETNPLDGMCDARVRVNARPLQIIYDAVTVNHLANFFQPPQDIQLKQLSQLAMSKYEDIKEQSATSLQHAIDLKKYTEIAVDLMSSYIIVPHGGLWTKHKDVSKLILDLGHLKIGTQKRLSEEGHKRESIEEVMGKAYDTFNISLDNVQLMMIHAGEDWKSIRRLCDSPMHILCPISLSVLLQKCMFDNDQRMAKMKIKGLIPLLSLNISDRRLHEVISLATSIPLPELEPAATKGDFVQGATDIPLALMVDDMGISEKVLAGKPAAPPTRSQSQESFNYTDVELEFELKKITLNISQRQKDVDLPLLRLMINDLGTMVKVRTFDLKVEASLGGIYLQYLKTEASADLATQLRGVSESLCEELADKSVINLVNTPRSATGHSNLLLVSFLKANVDAPDFATTYKKTEQSLNVEFSALELLLHQEAILDLIVFAESLRTPEIQELENKTSGWKSAEEEEKTKEVAKKKTVFKKDPEVIDLKVKAGLKMFSVTVCSQAKLISDVKIRGIEADVTLQERQTLVTAVLKGISVRDPSPLTLYPNILEIEGSEVLTLNLALYNNNTEGVRYEDMNNVDMMVKVTIGKLKVTFLNKFVMDLMAFLDNFQQAQAKLKEASAAMAEITQDAVQNFQETASRLSLLVEMHAPIIFMPQTSRSYNVLLVDLGHLQVKNSFEKLSSRSSSGIPAVLDKMSVTLTSVKLSRAIVDASQFVKSEVEILQPVTISVNVCRNLSAAWYHDCPDVNIEGSLNIMQMCMSQGDFKAMMLTLDENLTEGQDKSPVKSSVTVETTAPGLEDVVTKETSSPVQGSPDTPVPTSPKEAWCKLRFNFIVNSLTATLYSGESQLTSGLTKRDYTKLLGSFGLDLISLKGQMMSNNSLEVTVKLRDMTLDDKRIQKQGGITKMMERSKKGGARDMIDVSFKQLADDKTIDVHMYSLYLCVCLDFIMAVADFFVKGLPSKETASTHPTHPTDEKKAIKAKPEEVPAPVGEMNISVVIDRPEIIMIEDQARETTNALMLDMELKFQMRQCPETMDMSASIRNLGIVSSKYNSRTEGGAQILTPCDISFYSKTPHGQGAHMDVSTSDLILNISPATIRTMSAIAAGLAQKDETVKEEDKVPADLWQYKQLKDCNFWFLKTAKGYDVDSSHNLLAGLSGEILETRGEQDYKEKMILNVPSIVVKLEGGVGNRTVPLLITDMSLQGEVRDWTGKLFVESILKLEVAYYNERISVWEPLVEPVLDSGKLRKWELQLEVVKNEEEEQDFDDEDTEDIKLLPPKMSINLKSADGLQVTMTKACLESLTNLGKAFGDAYALVEPTLKAGEVLDPYVIQNETGEDIVLKLDNTFVMPDSAQNAKVKLRSGDLLPLKNKEGPKLRRQASVIRATQNSDEKKLIFQVERFNIPKDVTIKRAERRLFHFAEKQAPSMWAVVVDTRINLGQKTVTFRSAVQVQNHLPVPVDIYYKDASNGTKLISPIQPGALYSVPLYAVYESTGQFMFRPMKDGCVEMSEPISWKGAENLGLKMLTCRGDAVHQPFYIRVRAEIEDVYYQDGDTLSAKSTIFHLHPTVIFHNLLPYDVKVMLEGSIDMGTADEMLLQKGCNIPLDHACLGKTNIEVMIINYQGRDWNGRRLLDFDIPELSVWNFDGYQGKKKVTMDLGLHFKKTSGSIQVSLFCPYWMINKTGVMLRYKAGDDDPMEHPPEIKDIVMFSFKKSSLFNKKKDETQEKKSSTLERKKEGKNKPKVKEMKQSGKACLCIGEGDWSDKFSLDVVGSSGTVQSKNRNRFWEVGVNIVLSSSGLSKVVTFTPYYMLVNTSPYDMICKELTTDSTWIQVPSKQCVALWPLQSGKEMKMQAAMKDSEISTNSFVFNMAHTTLLRLNNQYGGINVECQETESAMVTTLTHYKDGMATVHIINHTDLCVIEFYQSSVKNVQKIAGGTAGLYTWEDAIGKRELVWSCGEKKEMKNDLTQDGIGEFFYDPDIKVYWVSFLSSMQRVLLFTHDLALATVAQEAGELERLEQEITVSIQDIGLSLVNNFTQREVAYLGITSSGIIWEEKRKRFKALNMKTTAALETAYQKWDTEKLAGKIQPERLTIDKMEINFAEMMMFKPNKRHIRRSFENGLWLQYKTSPHQVQFHAKINRVQMDNQVAGAVFPTILSPMPPPKSVAADSVPKPFTEVSMMLRKHEHSNVSQMKYFKVLIQEMQVKVDQGFLNNLLEMFSADQDVTSEQQKQLLDEDIEKTRQDLITTMGLSLASENKMFYDHLHLSPIKVHLSFSLQGGGGDGKPTQIRSNVINVFLQSVGVVLTDIQDVVFKLGYFQREHMFYNNKQLTGEMTGHYAGQAVKQMYVLVLGLDVLGNPFGLLRGMAEGMQDLFYEPYQGAIQGPEEFAEGMMLGVKSLFGHAVGGAAGAVSRITGTLGKGIAALTLDDEYQKKRREALNKRPANVGEGFARGGKGLVMGVFDGVTGIVRKPIEGAKKEGVEGFFKGVGKGLVGVVTRPTSGVIDFASSSFEGIKRIADNVGEIHRLRAPRRFHKDGIIRPYNRQEAEGCAVLMEAEKGRYLIEDYVAHVVVTKDNKNVFLVTNKRLLFASRGEIFGSWNCEFTYIWAELKEKPKVTTKGIEVTLKEKEKRGLFGSSISKKEIHVADLKLAEWMVGKISEAWDANN